MAGESLEKEAASRVSRSVSTVIHAGLRQIIDEPSGHHSELDMSYKRFPWRFRVSRDISEALLLFEQSWITCEGCNFGRGARHAGLAFHRVHA